MLILFDGELGPRDTLRFVEEKIGVGLWSLDVDSGAMRWSPGLYALLGLEFGAVEPTLTLFRSMMHPDDRLSRGDVDRILRGGASIDREFRIIRRDGRIRWVANRGEPVLNGMGQAARAIGVIYDITGKQNAQSELRANEKRYRTLTRAVATIVWRSPPDGEVIDFPEWQEITGQSQSEIQGKGWLDAVHPDDRAYVANARARSIALRTTYNVNYRVRLKDGNYRWFNARAAPVRGPNGELVEWIGILIENFSAPEDVRMNAGELTGAQARAARAILNWSVKDVAVAAKVSISTVRRLEDTDGSSQLRDDLRDAIKAALEKAGVEFLYLPSGPPAVRPRRTAL